MSKGKGTVNDYHINSVQHMAYSSAYLQKIDVMLKRESRHYDSSHLRLLSTVPTYPISKLLFHCSAVYPLASLALDPSYPKPKDRVQISSNKLLIKTLLSGKAGKSLSFSMTGEHAFISEWPPQSDNFQPLAGLVFSPPSLSLF